jgi:hypothetical protein
MVQRVSASWGLMVWQGIVIFLLNGQIFLEAWFIFMEKHIYKSVVHVVRVKCKF